MTKLFAALASVAAIALAAPADAQSRYGHDQSRYGYQTDVRAGGVMGIRNQIAQLEARIDAGIRAGTIDRREARRLSAELRQIQRLEAQYSRGGLSREQHAVLHQRVRTLHRDIRVADRGSWDRYDRFAEYDDPRYGYDPYGRDRDPYGRYQGRGGPMEPIDACEPRGGVGGLIGGLLGIDQCPGLRVGQRVTGNLYGVPMEYRDQFRDGGGVYHRSDGRVIYAIDARSHTVVRVYPLH